ncbi:symporter small accessory protein [Siminovitchia terrae]
MLGMEDFMIVLGWIGTVISMVGCVVFGVIMWNKGADSE